MTTTVLVTLFIAIVGRFMADEVKAWLRWVHRKLRRKAVAKLPAECRERYDEEWESGLNEIPGEIFKLIYSLGLLRAAHGILKVTVESSAQSGTFSALLRRVVDIAFSGTVLLLCGPLMLAIAIAIRLDSRGPVFYASERVGKKGRVFHCLKFRTMVTNSDQWRVTPLGRFLRRYSWDEFPQFFNVLIGDMSIVGPRPTIPNEKHGHKLNHLRRFDVAPGLTGLSQLQELQGPPYESPTSVDEASAKTLSIGLYIRIILRTFGTVLMGKGSTSGHRERNPQDKDD